MARSFERKKDGMGKGGGVPDGEDSTEGSTPSVMGQGTRTPSALVCRE